MACAWDSNLGLEDHVLPGFAGAEHGSRDLQPFPTGRCLRVRATEHTPRNSFNLLERGYGLVEIVERGAVVLVGMVMSSRS